MAEGNVPGPRVWLRFGDHTQLLRQGAVEFRLIRQGVEMIFERYKYRKTTLLL
jgi:hypothetical protein